mmetsp:Transcript_15374/g.33664  ORF Transcript_15374/g.33664 Transcript_15374/m.33664 type:complete len:82 (+) Transcript_15374:1505-1750(+)
MESVPAVRRFWFEATGLGGAGPGAVCELMMPVRRTWSFDILRLRGLDEPGPNDILLVDMVSNGLAAARSRSTRRGVPATAA